MRINRRFLYSVVLLLSQVAFSKEGDVSIKKTLLKETSEKRNLASSEGILNVKLCDPDFIGAIETSLLRLARGNLVDISTRWNRSLIYKMDSDSSGINVKTKRGDSIETLSEKDPLSRALSEESAFIKKIAQKKLSKNISLYFVGKQSFEFQNSSIDDGKTVELFKWNFEREGLVYSYGLVVPSLNNVDPDNLYHPLVPHCSEEKITEFKEKFKPLRFLWSSAGVLSGEQGAMAFKLLRDVLPEASK